MKTTLAIIAAAALLIGAAARAEATIVTEVALPQLTDHAELIVRGTVEKRRTTNESGRLYTQVTLRVSEVHKGAVGPTGRVVVRIFGGRSGITMSRIAGEPEFELGQEVFLFLGSAGPHYHRVVAMAQGKWDISRDPVSRAEHLSRDLSGLSFISQGPDGKPAIVHADDATQVPLSYRELVSEVRRQLIRRTAALVRGAVR